jgi:GNAT superfamily N-acetyltransferase
MDKELLLHYFDQEIRIGFTPPHTRREAVEHAIRFTRPAGLNSIIYCRCNENQADEVIGEQVSYLSSLDRPFVWTVYEHDRPANLGERLAAHGLAPDEIQWLMALNLKNAPLGLLDPVEADVRRVERGEQLQDVSAIMHAVWGGDFDIREKQLGYDFETPGYVEIYIAYVQGVPACVGRVYFYPNSRFAILKGGTTLSKYRQQGLYTTLLAARIQAAKRRGCDYLTIEANAMSGPIVAQHGFQCIETLRDYLWKGE